MHRRRWTVALLITVMTSTGCGYNQIQALDEQVNSNQGRIAAQLQRRADLVPNLVETVRGYAAQEERIFTEVARARTGLAGAAQSGNIEQMEQANQQMTGALGRLLAIVEAYPQLRSDQNFMRLQDELSGTENRIAVARNDYNESVRQHNAYVRRFPQALTARVIGAGPRPYFEAQPGATEVPQVDFSRQATPTQ